ncbi:MAG: polysaccharide deacetylase family protein [Clostridia bacterium]|nr:polysaccharide deacetylase family protein [Clostridia bacterium]
MKRAALTVFLALVLLLTAIVPTGATAGNVFAKNSSAIGKIALTFDDGPHPIYTPKILEILEEYGVSATFFVIGKNVENYPDAFRAILDSGCEIGNHTYTHKNMEGMNDREIRDELEQTEAAVAKACERRLSLLRPPEGSCGAPLERVSVERGYDVILWSIDTLDWAHTPSDIIARRVLSNAHDGDIILMHDYVSHGSTTLEALRIIIPELLARGYEFVTVSELLGEE